LNEKKKNTWVMIIVPRHISLLYALCLVHQQYVLINISMLTFGLVNSHKSWVEQLCWQNTV